MKALSRSQSIVSVILGMAALGSIGIFVRQTDQAIPPITQSLGRIAVSFILIALYILFTNRKRLRVAKTDMKQFMLAGFVGYTIMAIAFTLAVLKTTIANTYFLLYTAPVFVAILGYLFLKEKISLKIIVAIVLSLFGTILLFNPSGLQKHLVGNLLGLLTGISYAVYIITAKGLSKKYPASTITLWAPLFGTVGLVIAAVILESPFNIGDFIAGMLPIIKAGFFVFVGYALLNIGLRGLSATYTSILALFEPLSSVFYGLVFFSEIPGIAALLGSILILGSIVLLSLKQKRKAKIHAL